MSVIDGLKTGPIAENTIDANEQHYEVPGDYFKAVLGPKLKYSCCWFDDESVSLGEGEIKMMESYLERAKIEDGQMILDLGCGWGSLSLFLAERFPNSAIYSVRTPMTRLNTLKTLQKRRTWRT
ncbi:MAG: hypothetical protein Ct9H90mP13_11990 [Pseudomonadota bacterium]|nr:MAG: hypothetical protein Ct9H90mP13_11990 [Pseudomonadota bacterium]